MYRNHTCGELNIADVDKKVTLAGWVQTVREMGGGMTFVDLRDRYGITQLAFSKDVNNDLYEQSHKLGREFVLQVTGRVQERYSKNMNIPTGEIEIVVEELVVLNKSETPPFTIEEKTDGGDDVRMKYRYLDLRRSNIRENMILRHKIAFETRRFLDERKFIEVETPVLIGSTPEGARDFVVPSRMNPGEFYALPQSPQLFKQLLMVSGFDRYFQIVKCFRDEDLRADRQPEFTQIDCEMSFVDQEDVIAIFEELTKHLFKTLKGIELPAFPRMTYADAMRLYGSDKPDTRFDMKFVEIKDLTEGKNFSVFDSVEYVGAICAKGAAKLTRKELDNLTKYVQRPQVGAKGMIYCRYEEDGSLKSSVDKFYNEEDLKKWADRCGAEPGDLILVICGSTERARTQLGELRLEVARQLGLIDKNKFNCLWVVDFPLLEHDEELNRYFAKHHPFTSPKKEDIAKLDTHPGEVNANAYDLVINGWEVGGGSVRIHDNALQKKMFQVLGFTEEKAQEQFGFLMSAFKFGAPPHAGLAFGLDRLASIFAGLEGIRDVIAFPKNNSGRDVMIDAPAALDPSQLDELGIQLMKKD